MRSSPVPETNISPNSSLSICVTRPEGKTFHSRPSTSITRVGMSLQLHFTVDARRVDERLGSAGVRRGERVEIVGLEELQEGALELRFLEHVEPAVRAGVVVTLRPHPLDVLLAVGLRHDGAVHR